MVQAVEAAVEITDLDAIEQVLSTAYARMRLAPGAPGSMRMASMRVGSARLDQFEFTVDLDAGVEPLGALVFFELISGRVSMTSDRHERRFVAGDLALAAYPEEPHVSVLRDVDMVSAVLDPAELARIAVPAPGGSRHPVRFTGYRPVSARAARLWRATVAYVRESAAALPDEGSFPLLTAGLDRLLLATALTVFPNDGMNDPTIEDRHDAHPATLRRAIAYIEANAHRDIAPADIADACFVTLRAIQLAFRRHLDTTPTEYLRRIRLDHAHRDLLSADPAHDTVTAIAYRWGFSGSSRFASAYRRIYGVTPSQTLRTDRR